MERIGRSHELHLAVLPGRRDLLHEIQQRDVGSPFIVAGVGYAVSVQACNASGCSPYSATVTPTVVQN